MAPNGYTLDNIPSYRSKQLVHSIIKWLEVLLTMLCLTNFYFYIYEIRYFDLSMFNENIFENL